MNVCEFCGFRSTFSGIVRHRNNNHNVQVKKPVEGKRKLDDFDTSSDSSGPGVCPVEEIEYQIGNPPSGFDPEDLEQLDPRVNNFYLQCQFQQLAALENAPSSERTSHAVLMKVMRLCQE